MDYEAEKEAILAENDFQKLLARSGQYADAAADAARRDDAAAMHEAIRLGHWVDFRTADFRFEPLGLSIVHEHQHAVVEATSTAAFAAAIEVDPPPTTFDEAITLAGASRGN